MSYAGLAALNTEPKWFECFLTRDDDTVSYTLSDDDIAIVIFKLLKFSEKDVMKIDVSAMKAIKIKVRPEVNLENHKTATAMVIKPGLYLQAMKEVKMEKSVRLSWLPSDVSDEKIIEVMQMFGKVLKPPTDAKFIIKDSAPELTKRLRNILSNDRILEMVV